MNEKRLSKFKEDIKRGIAHLEANANMKFTPAERIIFISGYFVGRASANEEIEEREVVECVKMAKGDL